LAHSSTTPVAELATRIEPENPFLHVKASDWSAVTHYLHHVWYQIFPFMCRGHEETAKTRLLKLLGQPSATYHTIMAVAKYSRSRVRDCQAHPGHETSRKEEDEWRYHYGLAARKYQDGLRALHDQNQYHLEEATVCAANFIFLQVSTLGYIPNLLG
jgi:hypothetical protein